MSTLDLSHFKSTIADIQAHEHPSGYDLYCHNLQSWMGERAHLLVAEIGRLNAKLDEAEENQRELSKDWAATVRQMQAEINELTRPATRGDQAAEFGDTSVVLGTEWALAVSCPACGTPERLWCFEATNGGHAPGNLHDERKARATEAQT